MTKNLERLVELGGKVYLLSLLMHRIGLEVIGEMKERTVREELNVAFSNTLKSLVANSEEIERAFQEVFVDLLDDGRLTRTPMEDE